MARKRSKALGTAQSVTPAMPIADVLDASAFGIEDIVTTPSSIPKPVLQMPAVSGPAPTLKLPSLQTVINGVHSANTGSYEYASSSGAKTSGYEDLAAEQMYRPSAEPAPLRGNQAFDLRGAMNQSILADDDLANQMANGREAAAKARWDANTAEGDEIQENRKIDKAMERNEEASQARASQKAHDEKIAAEKAEAEKAKIAKRDRAVGRILNYLDTDDDLDDGIHGVTKQDFVDRALDLKKKNPKYKEALEGLGKKRLGDLYDSYGKDRRETLRLQGALDESAEAAEAARAKKVRDAALQEYNDPKNIGDGYLGAPTGGNEDYYDGLLKQVHEERASQKAAQERQAKAKSVMDRRNATLADRERYENGDYSTEHDAEFSKLMQERRKAWAAKHGGDPSGFDRLARKNPGMVLDKSKGQAGLIGDFKDFLGRQRHAHMNVVQGKARAKEGLTHIRDAMKGGTFASLRTGEGGKGFLSKGETEHIIQQTSGKSTRVSRTKDRISGFINRHSHGLTNLRTNRVEEIQNQMAMEKMHEKEKAIKRQIKGYNSLDKRIKNYDPAAMNGAHTRKGAVKEAQRSVAKSQAASKAKNLEGLGWKAKAGAVGGLLALGAVLGNMMGNHGEQNNAQLYNPNPQPQYAN